jgi:hypothetical protein
LSAPSGERQWALLSSAERDAACDNNAAVANSAALIAERNAASAIFRATHNGALDLAYGPAERPLSKKSAERSTG